MQAPPGYKLIEADYSQAELFVLSHVAGDLNMIKLLTTPGKDMHRQTAIDAFDLEVLDEKLEPVDDDYAVKFATEDLDNFEEWQAKWQYRQPNGEVLSHSTMKKGPRANAKSVNYIFALYKPIELLETCNAHNHNVTGNGKRDGLRICVVGQSAAKHRIIGERSETIESMQFTVEASRVGAPTPKRWGRQCRHDMVRPV